MQRSDKTKAHPNKLGSSEKQPPAEEKIEAQSSQGSTGTHYTWQAEQKILEEMINVYESLANYLVVFNYPKFPEDI